MTLNTLSVKKRCFPFPLPFPPPPPCTNHGRPPGLPDLPPPLCCQDHRRSLLLPILPWPTSPRDSLWESSPATAPSAPSRWTCGPPRQERSCGPPCLPWPEAWGLAGSTTGCSRRGGAEVGWGLEQTALSRPPPTLCRCSSPLSVTQLHFLLSIITFHITSWQIHFSFLCAPLLVPVSILSRSCQHAPAAPVTNYFYPVRFRTTAAHRLKKMSVGVFLSHRLLVHFSPSTPHSCPPPWDVYLIHSLALQCCHDNRRGQPASACAASLINKGSLLWQQEPQYKPQKKTFLTSWGEYDDFPGQTNVHLHTSGNDKHCNSCRA